jgi:hypothetical protein
MVLISEFIFLHSIISVVHIFMDEFFIDDIELSSLTTHGRWISYIIVLKW